MFASHGTKKIEFTAKDGMTISRQIEVQPVRVESAVGKFGIMNTPNFCFDFAQLGTLQALTSDGYYKWNDYKYEKQPVFDFSDNV